MIQASSESVKPGASAWALLVGALTSAAALTACHRPDPRQLEGALAFAAEAVSEGDKARLFRVIDQRARHALASIASDRSRAAAVIQREYPREARADALAALGPHAAAADATALFSARCDRSCLRSLRDTLAAPVHTRRAGRLAEVQTVRGGTLRLYLGDDTWWGIVWNTDALLRERDRAAADLRQVRRNARVYAERRSLR